MTSTVIPRLEDRFHTVEQYAKKACFACGMRELKPVACTRCKRVAYCNRTCQKLDYPVHKHICKAWEDVRAMKPSSSYPVLDEYPPDEFELRDVMQSMSVDMMGPIMPRCGRCLTVDGAADKKLDGCTECVYRWCADKKCVDTCKDKHKESGLCEKLQTIAKDERFLRTHEAEDRRPGEGPMPLWCPPRVLKEDQPLPEDWQAYVSSVQAPHRNVRHGELERAFFQHSLSIPLTIVAGLERFGLRSKFSDRTNPQNLTVHLIGAEVEYELMSVGYAYEEISHLLPGVKRLRISHVEPSLNLDNESVDEQDCCPTCQEDERTRIVETRKLTYHDYVRTHEPSPADIAIAFNSGMHSEPQKGSSTLSVLLANRTPTVMTAFNATEARDDAKVVTRKAGAGVEWVWREEKNKWKGGRDHFDVTSPEGYWSENQYWMGWRGV